LRPSFFIAIKTDMPDELLDIINNDDIIITQQMRSVVHRQGLLHRGVHIFLVTPDGRLLVQKRSQQRDNFPLALDCSVSEHVKASEDYLQAAMRGLREELGLLRAELHPLVKFQMSYGVNDEEISLLYESTVDPALVQFDPEEVDAIAYYSLDELATMIRNGETVFCTWFIQLIRWYLGESSDLKVMQIYTEDHLLLSSRKRKH
jgi:isopentenyldiphosphate isomerase